MGALLNTGDRTFITTNPQDLALVHAIRLPLPGGALGIKLQSGFNTQDLTPGVGGVQVTSPVTPGRHEFALSFELPHTGSSADVTLQLPYPTATYSIYVPETGVRLNASGLAPDGSMALGDQSYTVYRASNVPRAAIIPGELSELSSSSAISPTELTVLSLAVVLLVFGGGAVLFTRRTKRTAPQTRKGPADVAQERLDLVVRIAMLDERFAAGEVSDVDYRAQRTLAKERLRELASLRR
jgi:hypothetical protein